MRKTVLILVGCKGSGKTHTGDLAARAMDTYFLVPGEDGWHKVESTIDNNGPATDSETLEAFEGLYPTC